MVNNNELTKEEIERYSRHIIIPEVGIEGQKRLKAARVLLIGAGGLGSPLAMYLAASGIGTLGLVDFDNVDVSNLQRQVIHPTENVGKSKLESAKEGISKINPHINVELYNFRLSSGNTMGLFEKFEIIIDGTDNFPTRYLVNDACVLLGKPNIYGSIFRFDGQASVFDAKKGPCYRCLYPSPPPPGMVPSCAEGGVLGVLPGIIGLIQATEAVKLILNKGNPLIGRLLLYNALDMNFRELNLRKDPSCPICGNERSIYTLMDYEQFCGVRQPEKEQSAAQVKEITPLELKDKMERDESFLLIDVREPHEYEMCAIPGSKLIPLGALEEKASELDRNIEIVVHCKSGARSARGVKILKMANFTKLKNLKGGILAWVDDVDNTMAKY